MKWWISKTEKRQRALFERYQREDQAKSHTPVQRAYR